MNATVTVSKPEPGALRLIETIVKWRPAIRFEVPEAYQDEQGFHYGSRPAEKKIVWPPVE